MAQAWQGLLSARLGSRGTEAVYSPVTVQVAAAGCKDAQSWAPSAPLAEMVLPESRTPCLPKEIFTSLKEGHNGREVRQLIPEVHWAALWIFLYLLLISTVSMSQYTSMLSFALLFRAPVTCLQLLNTN